ncbi:MAG: SMI1/KNR4 family protein [Acidobacteriota bacterium]
MNFKAYCEALSRLYAEEGFALRLRPGAAKSALDHAEAQLGFALAVDLRGAWLHADGGEPQPVFVRPGYLDGYEFLSLEQALRARDRMKRRSPRYEDHEQREPRDARIRPGWFQEGWLPFASFGGGTLLLIQDQSPTSLGRSGQIIAFTHDPDSIDYVAPDLAELLSASLESIANDTEDFFIGLED